MNLLHPHPLPLASAAPAALAAVLFAAATPAASAGDDSRFGFSLSLGTGIHDHHGLYGPYGLRGLHDEHHPRRHPGYHRGSHYGWHRYGLGRSHYGPHSGYHYGDHDYHHRESLFDDHHDRHFPGTHTYFRYRSYPRYSVRRYSYSYIEPNTARLIPPRTYTPRTNTRVYSTTRSTTYADGWAYLCEDDLRAREAIDAFATEAQRHPGRGLPRIGYAISQALAGNEDKAVWAMRRALACEPESLKEVDADPALRRRINELAAKYDRRVREGFSRSDDLFMLAALRTIQGEYAAAYKVIRAAIERGDTEPTTRALRKLIDEAYE